MNSELLILASLLLSVLSLALFVLILRQKLRVAYSSKSRFKDVLEVDEAQGRVDIEGRLEYWCSRLGLGRMYLATGVTSRALLDQAGIYRADYRVAAHVACITLPIAFAVLGAGYTLAAGDFSEQGPGAIALGALFGHLLPRYGLRYMADRRRDRLRDETLIMAHLLKVLFEAGLSIEQALRTIRSQSDLLLPQMCSELDQVLHRIDAGMDCADILGRWAREVNVREVTDLAEVLSQLQLHGGNIQKRLSSMITLMEDRSRTELTEKIGKLSGKMTVVMMLFLFPALMILVAGPGVLSITSALGGL